MGYILRAFRRFHFVSIVTLPPPLKVAHFFMSTRYAEVHKNLKGPGDARPTTVQVIHDEGLEGQLTNKTILITGVSSGI